MRKSADITKYEPEWQMIRVKIKGPTVPLDDKLRIARQYFDRHRTIDAWERVVNWLEGLSMGYRASGDTPAIERIAQEVSQYNGQKPNAKEPALERGAVIQKLSQFTYQDRLLLWKDLFDRNKKWLMKGYNHQEHNDFTDALWYVFTVNHERVPEAIDMRKLVDLKKQASKIKNTHKFFF